MKRAYVAISTVTVILGLSCSDNKSRPAETPAPETPAAPRVFSIKTSIGNLVRMEQMPSVQTSGKMVVPRPEQAVYVLTFEGNSELVYEGKSEVEGPNGLLLIDPRGNRFAPEFAGTPAKDGVISDKEWKLTGAMKAKDGKWIFVGKATLPEPRIAIVYVLPKGLTGLSLKDGKQQHALD